MKGKTELLTNFRVNALLSGPIFWSQCFFSIPHCIARSIKNTSNISGTFKSLRIDSQLEHNIKCILFF
jgi:hypothetical protein